MTRVVAAADGPGGAPAGREPDHRAVRHSYDLVAEQYAASFRDELSYKPLDRALLQVVLEQRNGGPVADLGCGPGHVAGWLAGRGAVVVGVDLSEGMLAVGRRDHPRVQFRRGDLLELPAADGEFAAVVGFYSVIHLVAEELGRAFREMHRVLRPGGWLLVSFHVGDEVRHRAEWFGQQVDVDFRFFQTEQLVAALTDAGLAVQAQLERVNYPQEGATRRGYLLARRPG